MALECYYVKQVERKEIKTFIEENHYSKSINGCIADYCYALYDSYGLWQVQCSMEEWLWLISGNVSQIPPVMLQNYEDCVVLTTPLEMRRVFHQSQFKAFEIFLGRGFKGKGVVVSYADKEYGHQGTIYKASNFKMVGKIKGAKVIIYNGKQYHDKTIRTKYKGELKPFAKRIKEALDNGDAYYKKTAGKVTYVYFL